MQQDIFQLTVSQEEFQTISFFGYTQQIHQGEPSYRPFSLLVVPGQTIIHGLQMLHANLEVHGSTDQLNNIYNLVHQ